MDVPLITSRDRATLGRIRSLFKSWNEHTPAAYLLTMIDHLIAEEWSASLAIAAQLDPYLAAFAQGDEEGQFYFRFWGELKGKIRSQPVQLRLLQ